MFDWNGGGWQAEDHICGNNQNNETEENYNWQSSDQNENIRKQNIFDFLFNPNLGQSESLFFSRKNLRFVAFSKSHV